MKCLKANPHRNLKLMNAVELCDRACNINIVLIANFLETLRKLYPERFGKRALQNFLTRFMGSVKYLEADDDTEVREYRMDKMLNDMPYISKTLAEVILKELSGLCRGKDLVVLKSPFYKAGLVENIVLMLATLHYDYGYGESRINAVITAWCKGTITEAAAYMQTEVDYINDPEQDKREIEKKLLDTREKKERVTVREQFDARRELEALKKYQEEICRGESSS